MGSALLPTLRLKREVDAAIRDTLDKVLVLRFGRTADAACLHLDDIVSTPPTPSRRSTPLHELLLSRAALSLSRTIVLPFPFTNLASSPRRFWTESVIARFGVRCSLLFARFGVLFDLD